jgi:hypothetical protein
MSRLVDELERVVTKVFCEILSDEKSTKSLSYRRHVLKLAYVSDVQDVGVEIDEYHDDCKQDPPDTRYCKQMNTEFIPHAVGIMNLLGEECS